MGGATKAASSGTAASDSARFCFQSPLWDALIQDSFDLQEVYRQSGDDDFITVLNSVRAGVFTEQCRQVLGACVGRVLDCGDGILPTQIFTHK
jgi:ATP-dependent DNA helicase PIF1